MRILCFLCLSFLNLAWAGTFINTIGSSAGIAIAGFDTVAFFTQRTATPGKPHHSMEWMGATWLFSSDENLQLFKSNPEAYAPQYGGHCAYGISENYLSKKPPNGLFDIVEGKLYLFPQGSRYPDGAYISWLSDGGPTRRIPTGDRNWQTLKAKLEAK